METIRNYYAFSFAFTAVCFALSRPISRLALVPFSLLFPVVFTLIIVGAYQSTRHFGDLLALVACGILGWLMKRFGFLTSTER